MEWIVVSIGLGLIVSLLFTEAFGLSVGGMIVPGYLALHFDQPLNVLFTLAAAILTWQAVRWISKHAIVFGRRRVVLMMLAGFLIGELLRQSLAWFSLSMIDHQLLGWTDPMGITVIGFVIPGLIALWIDRTSVMQTLSPLFAASGLVHMLLILVGLPHLG